jgi:hypothetical protein
MTAVLVDVTSIQHTAQGQVIALTPNSLLFVREGGSVPRQGATADSLWYWKSEVKGAAIGGGILFSVLGMWAGVVYHGLREELGPGVVCALSGTAPEDCPEVRTSATGHVVGGAAAGAVVGVVLGAIAGRIASRWRRLHPPPVPLGAGSQ